MTNIVNIFEIRRAKELAEAKDTEAENAASVGGQLSLPFGALDPMMLVDVRDFGGQDDFIHFCSAIAPAGIVDLRVAPRLDFVRPARKQAFELFDAFGMDYWDVLGRLQISIYDIDESDLQRIASFASARASEVKTRIPLIGLVDNLVFAQRCALRLSGFFEISLLNSEAVKRITMNGARQQM